jgi:hypothetical protein
MKVNNSIVEKIKKLLGLANSPNENEAKIATAKANELLIKYNLSLQEIEDHQNEYDVKDVVDAGLTIKPYQHLITSLLQDYFFVKILIHSKFVGFSSGKWAWKNPPRTQYKKVIQLVGTPENCEIAAYIFSYLNDAYPKLWLDYYERNSYVEKTPSHKQSYFLGLTHGIKAMLDATKWKVQEETGLVLKEDPKLKEFVKKNSSGFYGGSGESEVDPQIFSDGIRDGSKVTLRKPIEADRSSGSTKLISNKIGSK